MISSRVTSLVGIKYPIFQGGMAHISRSRLVAAVSEAGALGIIGAGLMSAHELLYEIKQTKRLTSKYFGVNLVMTDPDTREKLDIVLREKVRVLTTGAGNAAHIVEKAKDTGTMVIPVVASVPLAMRMEKSGAPAIIVEGYESGGHVGELTTLTITAMATKSISIPVIAAGGIADGRGMAAALALGAEGIQMGTAFCVAKECEVSKAWKDKVIGAGDRDAVVTGRSTGHPVRILRNRLSRTLYAMEKNGASPEVIWRLGEGRLKKAIDGDVVEGSVMCGQIAGIIDRERTASEIIESVMKEAEETIKKLNGKLTIH